MTTTDIEKPADTEAVPAKPANATRYYRPAVDIIEDSDAFTILADMPGVLSKDLDIQVEEGELTVHGKVGGRQPPGRSFLIREYGVGDFYTTFRINGEAVDAERISAELSDGVLRLRLPKTAAIKPRKIPVQGG